MTLYESLKAAGIETDHHESDLYFPATQSSREILARFPLQKSNARPFVNQVSGGVWIDVPFAWDPYWERVARISRARSAPVKP